MAGTAVQKQKEQPEEEWWSRELAAKYLGVSVRNLRRLAQTGRMRREHIKPAPGRPYQSVVYNVADVKAYKDSALAAAVATPVPIGSSVHTPASALPAALELLGQRLAVPPRVRRWLTLAEAVEYSGLPRAYLLKSARAAAFALNVGTEERPRWRFDRDQL